MLIQMPVSDTHSPFLHVAHFHTVSAEELETALTHPLCNWLDSILLGPICFIQPHWLYPCDLHEQHHCWQH